MPKAIRRIRDLSSDSKNARRHPRRNLDLIADTLRQVGAARSIVIDEDGVVLAGNGVLAAAKEAGIDRVQVVEADGRTLVAVRRSGLTDLQKVRLAVADNRANELSEWEAGPLADLAGGVGLELGEVGFTPDELAELKAPAGEAAGSRLDAAIDEVHQVVVECRDEQEQRSVYERLSAEGFRCRLLCL